MLKDNDIVHGWKLGMGPIASVFQTELVAILEAVLLVETHEGAREK